MDGDRESPVAAPVAPRRRRSRAARVAGRVIGGLLVLVVFVVALVASVILHVGIPVTRRVVAGQVSALLAGMLEGRVVLEEVDGISLTRLEGIRAHVRDEDDRELLVVAVSRIAFDGPAAARSFLFGEGDIVVQVSEVVIDHVAADLTYHPEGGLRLARAFSPRDPSTEPEPPPDPAARGVRVEAPSIALVHAWIHGRAAEAAPPVDVELTQLDLGAHYDPTLVRAELRGVHVHSRGMVRGADPRGRLTARFEAPADPDAMSASATFVGTLAGIATDLEASLAGEAIAARLDLSGAKAADLRAIAPEVDFQDEASLRAEVKGTTSAMKANLAARLGPGKVDVVADVRLASSTSVDAKVTVRDVDLRSAGRALPASSLALDVTASATVPPDDPLLSTAEVKLDTLPSTLAGQSVPPLSLIANADRGSGRAVLTIVDPRLKARVDARLSSLAQRSTADVTADVSVPAIERLPAMDGIARGRAEVRADAKVDLVARRFSADARVAAERLGFGAERVASLRVNALVSGPFDGPRIVADVDARGIVGGGVALSSASARASVDLGPPIVVSAARATIVKDAARVEVEAARVEVDGERIAASGVVVRGLGEPLHADVTYAPSDLRVRAVAPSLEVSKALAIAGMPDDVDDAKVALAVDLALRGANADGEIDVRASGVPRALGVRAEAAVRAKLRGRSIELDVEAQAGEVGRVRLRDGVFVLGGGPMDPASWKRAKGAVALDADVDLARAVKLAPKDSVPLSTVRGRLSLLGSVRRETETSLPEATLHVDTTGLVLAGAANDKGIAAWRTEGIEVAVDADVDARSGDAGARVRAWDRHGALVVLDAKTVLPEREIVAGQGAFLATVKRAPISARLVVPRRAMKEMPPVLGLGDIEGTVDLDLVATGTALVPQVDLRVRARGLRTSDLPPELLSDADVTLAYDGKAADLAVKVVSGREGERRETLALSAQADVVAKQVIEAEPGAELPWKARAKASFGGFALESIAPLADRRVRGRVSGEIAIDDLHEDAKVRGEVAIDGLRIGRADYTGARLVVTAGGGKLDALARIDQRDGFAELRAGAGLIWGSAVAPKVDPKAPIEASLEAKGLRAAAALPFLKGVVNELDGRVDARAKVVVPAGGHDAVPSMEGSVTFDQGRVALVAFGEELTNVRARLALDRGGVLRIEEVYAESLDGRVHAKGEVRARGMAFDSAALEVRIPKKSPMALVVQGSPYGDVWGDIDVDARASKDGDRIGVNVSIPRFSLEVPQNVKAGVQALERSKRVSAGVYHAREFVVLPLDEEDLAASAPAPSGSAGPALDVTVKLGEIGISYGRMARVVLTGEPKFVVEGGKTRGSGQIAVTEGKVDVQGKKFDVEKATVTLGDDLGNPVVVASAGWVAEDGTRIWADFVGPVKTGKVTLRSEPARPRNEILATILFGTADGANAPPGASGGSTSGTQKMAASVGGGFATQGLTEALDDVTGVQATARIDTSRTNNPAPEIELQVSRRISLALQHVLGEPPMSAPDKNLATVDWRFERNWSLETTVGDRGKAEVDAVWQKRY